MSRLDYRGMTAEPGPECMCGAELREVPLPADLAAMSGQETIWVHTEGGDTRCYPGESGGCTAEPVEPAARAVTGEDAPMGEIASALSDDGMTLVIKRRVPGGSIQTATYRRQRDAGPFTDADVAAAVARTPKPTGWLPGQRNRHRRIVTRHGTLWASLMLGPPTWWLPKARREKDGTVMAGWLRLAVAVKLERAKEDAR